MAGRSWSCKADYDTKRTAWASEIEAIIRSHVIRRFKCIEVKDGSPTNPNPTRQLIRCEYCGGTMFLDQFVKVKDGSPSPQPERWISVKERLPQESYTVIVACYADDGNSNWSQLAFTSWDIWYTSRGDELSAKVKFWQPLPLPPCVGKDSE